MKRKCRNSVSSCSSSSSSSCVDSPLIIPEENDANKKKPNKATKKIIVNNSHATSPKSRSSIYRGVTRHRWTGRFEAHLWDKTTWNNIQNKRGRQIYLGAYDNEDDAARTYDLAALKFWGPASILNFPVERYSSEVEEMQKLSKEEFLASLRRRSSGFSRGVSKYRGVARHHHNGRWEARIGRVCGNKYLYLGTYSTQEEAAAAYDMAAIEFRGPNAVTNFDISNYSKKDEIQVKQELNPQVQEDHDVHQHNSNQFVEPNNIPKLEESIDKDDHKEVEASNIPKFELIDSQDVSEHPWDLCLDMGFSSIPIPIEKSSEMLGLLEDKGGFEDNIEFIFDGHFGDREDAVSGTEECKVEADVLVSGFKSHDVSSPLSVCSNI